MSYPTYKSVEEVSLKDVTCPVCGGEKTAGYYFCDFDCYKEGIKEHKQRFAESGHKMAFPIQLERDFKHIAPTNKHLYKWDNEAKKWNLKTIN